jgi:hypothetical protein
MYADDVGLVAQAESFEEILNVDLLKFQEYFKTWYLTLNPNKTTSIVFHLNNKEASRKLYLVAQGTNLTGDVAPKYFGIKLDRTLTFNHHLEGVKNN